MEDDDVLLPDDDTPLGEARAWLRHNVDEGAKCPLCRQFAKVYKRKLNRTMVNALRLLIHAGGRTEFVHGPVVLRGSAVFGGEVGKLALFGLVEEERERRPDGGRSGWWMVTELGVEFLRGQRQLPKYAKVYDGRHLGFRGPQITVKEVAPEFRLDDLMGDV